MKRRSLLLLACLLSLPAGAGARLESAWNPPVVDLRVGLSRAMNRDPSLAKGVIATHSNARALADRPRNLSDAAIRGIAHSGGLIAVTALHGSLAAGRPATVEHLVRQISYLVGIAGPEHVALGTGFESGAGPVRDFLGAGDFPRLAVSLRSAGLPAADVERVFYRNAQRILCASEVANERGESRPK